MGTITAAGVRRRMVGMLQWARWSATPYPPGHYHSPLPALTGLQGDIGAVDSIPGVDLRLQQQLLLAEEFRGFYAQMPFRLEPQPDLRYYLDNGWFGSGDGIVLYSMLRHLRPHRYVEVGSGYSSACALDTAARFLDSTQMLFFDPNPQRLRSLLRPGDQVTIIDRPPARYRPDHFADLHPGDILFIDSSHVVKYGSEVNDLLLDVVPQLPAGVHVHVHDIFWPFSYSPRWIAKGRAWNEAYLLRGLLCGNPGLRITWFNDYLRQAAPDSVAATMPLWRTAPGGSIWLERV